MSVGASQSVRESNDEPTLAAVERSTSFARRALRARCAFFWSFTDDGAVLLSSAGDVDRLDVTLVGSGFGRRVLAATGPVARDAGEDSSQADSSKEDSSKEDSSNADFSNDGAISESLLGIAVRASGGEARGVLVVADPAPRAFDADDLDIIGEIGADLAREMERAAEAGAALPLRALVDLSDSLVRDATSSRSVSAEQYLAAADSLASAAARLRQLARQDAPSMPGGLDPDSRREGPRSPKGTSGARILVADDLDLNRKLISDMLTVEGHEVDCVADGAAAVRAVQAKTYDLVLMDMIMPGMDGIAATRAIRALPAPVCRVAIVALTANSFREQLASCLEAGMDATLTKPMTIDALAQAVVEWTRDRHQAA